jgi:hypothetical protein
LLAAPKGQYMKFYDYTASTAKPSTHLCEVGVVLAEDHTYSTRDKADDENEQDAAVVMLPNGTLIPNSQALA